MVSVTGYNPKGALNMVVVEPDSAATTLTDLAGKKVSASVGSAGHGTLVRALDKAGINPSSGVEVLNQQPQIGASALESGQVQGLSQFVAWPGLLVFQAKAKLLYDGAELNLPTLHGVVVRRSYASAHPEVLEAFLQAQLDATEFLNEKPLQAARIVADASGLPQEVVYLYNGPGGTSFDTTLKPSLVNTLKSDVPYLKSIGDFADLDVGGFARDEPLRAVFGARGRDYDAARAATGNPAVGSEMWLDGSDATQRWPTRRPCCKPSGTRLPTAPRSARPTFPTPNWAPAGSRTSRSGFTTARITCRSTPWPGHVATAPRIRARHRGLPTGSGRFAMTVQVVTAQSQRRSRRHWRRPPARLAVAVETAAAGLGGGRDRAVAVIHRRSGAVLAAVRHAADGHRDPACVDAAARQLRVLA